MIAKVVSVVSTVALIAALSITIPNTNNLQKENEQLLKDVQYLRATDSLNQETIEKLININKP
jgi:hypothetical protein